MGVQIVPGVTLGGIPLSCARGQTHSWTYLAGVHPYVGSFLVSRPRALAIQKRGEKQLNSVLDQPLKSGTRGSRPREVGPLTLKIHAPGRELLEIGGLYAGPVKAGTNLSTWTIQVFDARWLWVGIQVEKTYNKAIPSGETRWNGEEFVPPQAAETVADVTYRRATLRFGQPWTALEVLEDVLAELCGADGYVIEQSAAFSAQAPIRDLELSDPGPQALSRVLAHIPGVTVCPDKNGVIRVFSTLDQSEIAVASGAGLPLAGSGMWRVVDRSLVRPAKIRVYLSREQEVRFDLDLGSSFPRGKQPPWLENVIQVSDKTFELADGREVAAGSWITFVEFFAALASGKNTSTNGAGANPVAVPGGLTEDLVRAYSLAGLNYISRRFIFAKGTFDQVWAGRFAAVATHWRRSFRIAPQWADRMRTVVARRAVVTDAEAAKRAPAPVYTDFVLKPHLRTLFDSPDALGFQVLGWAADLKDATVAPVNVEVVNAGAGIIRLVPKPDLFGVYEDIQLGQLSSPAPAASAADVRALWVGSSKGGAIGLKADFKLSAILSMTPASPNNEGRLHVEEVGIAEAVELLGQPAPTSSKGPVFETMTRLESARFAWRDDFRSEILDAVFDGGELPRSLLANEETVRDVAKAQAARVASHFLDRAEGSFAVTLNPAVQPTGNLQAVTHSFGLDGRGRTTYKTQLTMPPASAAIRVDSLLPESTRRILLHLVQE